jgi:hypothetical protein
MISTQILSRFFVGSAVTLTATTGIATTLTTALPDVAQASPIVRSVSWTQAQGLSGDGATVTVWAGSGTNIDFTRTAETIERAWLDDPSRITIDFDGTLCNRQDSDSSSSSSCQQSGASIVHLRRVNEIKFPNLPASNQTLLTVVTRSDTGRKTYLFRITYGSGKPQFANLIVLPERDTNAANAVAPGIQLSDGRTANWNDVDRGLQQALNRGLIYPNSPVVARVSEFLARVRNGSSMPQAIQTTRVSFALISKLAQMGYSMTVVDRVQIDRAQIAR